MQSRESDDNVGGGIERTLNPYMDIILRLLGLAGIFVSFGEGVCRETCVSLVINLPRQRENAAQIQVGTKPTRTTPHVS